jgi:hypothetical protein
MTEVGFPGQPDQLLWLCHKTDTFYPVDPSTVFATTVDPGQTYSTTRFQGYDDPTKHYAITADAGGMRILPYHRDGAESYEAAGCRHHAI